MCHPALLAGLAGGGAATAAGATAVAATSSLASIGTALTVVGSLAQGVMAMQAGQEQSALLLQQAEQEKRIGAIEEDRTRRQFQFQMGQQAIELAGRGIRLDSPVAMFLGETAAREMSFEAQAVRSGRGTRAQEMTHQARQVRAQGMQGLLRGTLSAAGNLLTAAPRQWPGMLK